MTKRMLDENLMKFSEMADRSITDTAIASILLCYLLYRVEEPVDAELLYDIAVTGGIINFFTYQEAIQTLVDNDSIRCTVNDQHEKVYTVTGIGVESAQKLRNIAAKSYRDDIVSSVKRAMKRKRNQKDVSLSYEPLDRGCRLHVSIHDRDLQLLDLSLFTPDKQTAQQLGERILANPSALYHDVIQAVIREHEEPIDLTDN